MSLLAIDQGTTSTRAILYGAHPPRLLARHSHRQIYPAPGWVEHDPEEILSHVSAGLEAGRAAGVDLFALADQGESCLAWDRASGRAVSPLIVWQDARTAPLCAQLEAEGAGALTRARSGLPPDPYFSASKLGWIMRNIPEAAALARRGQLCLGTSDAFLRQRLTGRCETDIATASRTGLMGLASGRWDPELCALFGVPIDSLPAIGPCAGALGEARGMELVAALVDQQAALYGHGARQPGAAKITFGTGAFVLALSGPTPPAAPQGLLPTVAWQIGAEPVEYALEGGVHTAAAALDWARGLGLFDSHEALARLPETSALARGLGFVPALAGLASPQWDRNARGAWFGLSLDTDRDAMLRALLEGIAYRCGQILTAMALAPAPEMAALPIDGGLSSSPLFGRALANILRRPVAASTDPELTARGLALLGARVSGITIAPPPPAQLWQPDPDYPDLSARFEALCQLSREAGALLSAPC